LEEFAKAKWIEDYYWTSITNCGLPGAEYEQAWLKLLYMHSEKQYAFVGRDMFEYQAKQCRMQNPFVVHIVCVILAN
jgi:hypothetical protein